VVTKTWIEAVAEAYAHIGAARMQLIDSDDQIIAGHIRAAEAELRNALRALRRDPLWAIREISELLERQLPQGVENAARHIVECIEEFGRVD